MSTRLTDVENVNWNQHDQIDEREKYENPKSDRVDQVWDDLIYHSPSN
jgi:hypothetical protein